MSLDIDLYMRGVTHWDDGTTTEVEECVFSKNITHNLNIMAGEAGIYDAMWRPDENGITTSSQMIQPLNKGIILMERNPEFFKQFNPPNGWGSYEGLLNVMKEYLACCVKYPNAHVEVCR